MIALAALSLAVAVLLARRWSRRLRAEADTSRDAARRAAEERLEAARDLMLSIAEGVAKDGAARTTAIYAGPVRALPRPRISEPAPACCICARHEIGVAIVRASRAPVAGITGERGWHPPFVVRWGDA
jgi:hypothetical protein